MPSWPALNPPHFRNGRYFNPDARQAQGFAGVLRWKLTSRPHPSPDWVDDVTPSVPPPRISGDEWSVTIVNHSTVLLQADGLNLLTDPVWSDRVSPLTWAGPRRRRAPGVRLEDLPPIDAVLLSHNHYDHFDLPTLRRIAAAQRPQFIVAAGCGTLLRRENIGPVEELDWGKSRALNGTVIHCVPALHFSARNAFDRNRSLWCGYVIQSRGGSAYFAADTAFGGHLAAIRDCFGPPRVALLPIGAYLPRWFMGPVHMSPEDALEAHRILQPQVSIAIHHGTFQLADDALDEAAARLGEMGGPEAGFVVLRNGERRSC